MICLRGHNSPLFGRPEEESVDSPGYHWNSNYSAHFWLEGGAKPSQLLLGMATYGRGFMLANEVGLQQICFSFLKSVLPVATVSLQHVLGNI